MTDAQQELNQPAPPGTYLIDAYEDWAKAEGVPIHTGRSVDVGKINTSPWQRFGTNGAFLHLDGRCDFLSLFLLELGAGQPSALQQNLYEELIFVAEGDGVTEIDLPQESRLLTWSANTLLGIPMNARYRHRNTGNTPARIVAVNDMRYLYNLFRNDDFVFRMAMSFPERVTQPSKAGNVVAGRAFKHITQLDRIDVARAELANAVDDGVTQLPLSLAHNAIGADIIEIAPAQCTRAIRQFQGAHMIVVSGSGYALVSEDGCSNTTRVELAPGTLFAPPGMLYHQYFNTGRDALRFVVVQLGSIDYPMFRHRRFDYGDNTVYAAGYHEIERGDQPDAIFEAWRAEMNG